MVRTVVLENGGVMGIRCEQVLSLYVDNREVFGSAV
jgi:hypothetical protein